MAKIKLTQAANRERAVEVLKRLRKAYPEARCTLDYESPLELLVATILAAQCTDERVNIVTKSLFKEYRTAQDYVHAPQEKLEQAVRTCGFYRNKAKSIKKACTTIVEQFGGEVLTVGRRTAVAAGHYLAPCLKAVHHQADRRIDGGYHYRKRGLLRGDTAGELVVNA